MPVFNYRPLLLTLFTLTFTIVAKADDSLPPLEAFMMDEAREIALARSAAPDKISRDATIMVLREAGYETIIEGSNDFVCLVLRSWGNPTHDPDWMYVPNIIVPECLDRNATRNILPLQLFRAELGVDMTPGEEIKDAVIAGFRNGRFQRTATVSFSYMLSASMTYSDGSAGPPHVVVYLPDSYTNDMLGGLPYLDRVAIIEGGPDAPFVVANIYMMDKAIEPESTD